MAAPLSIDWDALKLLRVKGMSYKEIAKQVGIKETTVRKRGEREQWDKAATEAAQTVSRAVVGALESKGLEHGHRISRILERQLDSIERRDPDSLDEETLQKLVNTFDALDKIGRRTYGLDQAANQQRPPIAVQITVNTGQTDQPGKVIDVEAVALGAPELGDGDA